MTDEKLAAALAGRSEAAIAGVMERHSRRVYTVAAAVLRGIGSEEDAEEVAADTFVYLWEHPENFDPRRGSLKTWLSVVARSRALDRCREICRHDAVSLDETELADPLGVPELMQAQERRAQNPEYYAACAELLAPLGERVARPAPSDLIIDRPDGDVIFDPGVPADAQHLLTSENHTSLDAYGLPVAAAPEETALVLSALVPQRPGETDGGAPIPVAYLFTYFRTDIEKADYVFVHGQLVPLAEIENRRVYEDEQYVCYELSAYFYTDVLAHAEALCAERGDVCWDAAAQRRVENIHGCFTDPTALSPLIRHAAA